MKEEDSHARELIDQFLSALQTIPNTAAHLQDDAIAGPVRRRRGDSVVDARIGDHPVLILVEVRRSAFPRDVREAVWQIRGHLANRDPDSREALPVIIADSISPGAKALLREERVGYYDTGGSLFIPARGAYVFIDKAPPKRRSHALRSLFLGRRAQVLHAVLAQGQTWFGVTEIARQAGVSPATASQTLTELDRLDWVESRGQGPTKARRLDKAQAMLDAWVQHQSTRPPPPLRRYFVALHSGQALIRRLAAACEDAGALYAITGEAAAQTYAPFLSSVSQVRCRMLAGAPAETAIATLDARMVNEGWNLGVLESTSPGDFNLRQELDGVWLASPLQTYLDLLQGEGRAREMAEHLRRERLDY